MILVTGGAGFIGSNLHAALVRRGHETVIADRLGDGMKWRNLAKHPPALIIPPAEIDAFLDSRPPLEMVYHLGAVSSTTATDGDAVWEANVELSRRIWRWCAHHAVRLVYASSSSVYGIKNDSNVTEDLPLEPLTDYSKYKAMCEEVLDQEREPGFVAVTLRPATVCGYAPRLRLDLTVNILTSHAINNGRITVFGGEQLRPNLHVEDMTDLYIQLLEAPDEAINGKTWNAGYHNLKVREIANMVRDEVGKNVDIVVTPSDDHRSYHVSSEKIKRDLGFSARRTVSDAIVDLAEAFNAGKVPNAMTDDRYYNIKRMQALKLR